MFVEFHCHTSLSYDGYSSYKGLVEAAKKKGINVICLTEHDEININKGIVTEIDDIKFVNGCEFTAINGAHIIGLFINEKLDGFKYTHNEIFDHIKKYNGLISIPHPLKPSSGLLFLSLIHI